MRRLLVPLLAIALVVSACNNDDDGGAIDGSTTSSTPVTMPGDITTSTAAGGTSTSVAGSPVGRAYKTGRATITSDYGIFDLPFVKVEASTVSWNEQAANPASVFKLELGSGGSAKASVPMLDAKVMSGGTCTVELTKSDATAIAGSFDCTGLRAAGSTDDVRAAGTFAASA